MRIRIQTAADAKQRNWEVARLFLGMLQMGGAVVSLVLLAQTGVSVAALTCVTVTSGLTTVSVLLFGSRNSRRVRGGL